VVALFDRADGRDFADVFELSEQFSKSDLLHHAAQVDLGLDKQILAPMLRSLTRVSDQELPTPEERIPAMRDFFAAWAKELNDITPPTTGR
jgi:dihydropteroate synthase